MPSAIRAAAPPPASRNAPGPRAPELFESVQHDFALSSRAVFYVMAGVMGLAFLVALVGMPGGRAHAAEARAEPAPSG